MKKYAKFLWVVTALLMLLQIAPVPVGFAAQDPRIESAYYGIDRASALIGKITEGTKEAEVLSRVTGSGTLTLTGGIKTGSVLTLTAPGDKKEQLSLVVGADCNGDGKFSVTDMLMVKSSLLGLQKFNAAQVQAGDVNADGKVTITDFLQMKSRVLGLLDFSAGRIANAEAVNAILLKVGDTYTYGPKNTPTPTPSPSPTPVPTATPTPEPTATPTPEPTATPTAELTATPTAEPTATPTPVPTATPTAEPTATPTSEPTATPTAEPSVSPDVSREPDPEGNEPVTHAAAPAWAPLTVQGDAVTFDDGILTAVKVGTAKVTWGEKELLVTVVKEGLKVSLPDAELMINPKNTAQLQVSFNHPFDAKVSYKIDNTSVATVNENGVVTAVKEGTATVTATLENGSSDTQKIRVLPQIKEIRLAEDSVKVKNGGTKTLGVTVTPANATEKLIWKSSDPTIATVDANGVVKGLKNGTVTITCSSEYGNVSASCKVKVCNLIQVALTFDDGPSSYYTPKVLDMLKTYDAPSTFFMVGSRIKGSEDLLKRMVAEGHELGYHTWNHSYFFKMSTEQIRNDWNRFQKAAKAACGQGATVYRAPGGNINDRALNTIPAPHIMWTIDTRDWETKNTNSVKNAVLRGCKTDGAIILLHDIHGTTYTGVLAALKEIRAKDMDIEFLTVTELLSRKGSAPKNGVTYKKG